MTAPTDEPSHRAMADCQRYCVDGCSSGGEPVPIDDSEDDEHSRVVTGIGFLVAAVETAFWLAFL